MLPVAAHATIDTPYSWSGVYIGGNLGWGRDHRNANILQSNSGAPLARGGTRNNGVTGGGQVGFNYAFNSSWLIGVEADLSGADLHGSSIGGGNGERDDKVNLFGTARARLGYSPGRWLLYGTGGLAWMKEDLTRTQLTGSFNNAVAGTSEKASETSVGWTAGAGVERAVTRHISAKIEYLHFDLGSQSFLFPLSETRVEANSTFDIVRVGVNYRF